MSNARGDEAKLLARLQSAFGTAEAAAAGGYYALPFYTRSITPTADLTEDEAIYGDAYPGDTVEGLRNVGGNLVVPMALNSIGWHLNALLGAPTTTEPSTGKFQHVFATSPSPAPLLQTQGVSYSRIAQHFTSDSLAYTGFEIQARKNGERARATFNVIGREEVKAGATLDASPVAYSPDPVPVGFVGKCLIDGGEAAGVTGVSMTLNSGVELDQETLNGLATGAGIDWGMWALTGSIDARFRDATYYDLANDGTSVALAMKWTVSADYELAILAENVRLERTGPAIDNRGIISTTYNFRTNRPGAGQTVLTATLKNLTADYANAS